MKLSIDQIENYPLLDIHHLSDSIIRFKVNGLEAYQERIAGLEALFFSNDTCNDYRRAIAALHYKERKTDWQHLVLDMKLLLKADFYYTNGQEVYSLMEEERGWKVGKITTVDKFADTSYLFNPEYLSHLTSLDLPAFSIFEAAEFYVVQQLQKMEVIRLPLDNGTGIFLRRLYPWQIQVDLDNHHSLLLNTDSYDTASREIEQHTAPHRLQTCFNCKSFQYSGMSHSMSSGSKGYCRLVYDQMQRLLPNEFSHQAITHIWYWCSSFEARKGSLRY